MAALLRRTGPGTRLSLIIGFSVAALFLFFTLLLSQKASQQLEKLALGGLQNQSSAIVDMVQMFNTSLSEETARSLREKGNHLTERVSLFRLNR